MVFEKNYAWKRNMPVRADVIGKEFERIEAEQGAVTDRAFLDASRDESAPGHKLFEWDDAKAAENYRLVQSRNIINNLTVTLTMPETGEKKTTVAFVNVNPVRNGGRYVSIPVALENEDARNTILSKAYAELESFKRKYETLAELADIISAINNVIGDRKAS